MAGRLRFNLTLRKRIFGGFAVVLLLLTVLAFVVLRGMNAIGTQAARVNQSSERAAVSTDLALQVGEARALVARYAVTATLDDQKAARESLSRLSRTIDSGDRGSDLAALASSYPNLRRIDPRVLMNQRLSRKVGTTFVADGGYQALATRGGNVCSGRRIRLGRTMPRRLRRVDCAASG